MARTLAVLLLLTALSHPVQAQQTGAPTVQEQEAIRLVNEWNTTWATNDAEKLGAFMAEDCLFRMGANDPQLRRGRAAFVEAFKPILADGMGRRKVVLESHAIGGATGTVILQQRIDTTKPVDGPERTVPVAAFLRVRDGKIQEWLDVVLVAQAPRQGGAGTPPTAPRP